MKPLELINLVDQASTWSESRTLVDANRDLLDQAFDILQELVKGTSEKDESERLKTVQLYFERCLSLGVAHATAEQIAEVRCDLPLENQSIYQVAGQVQRMEATLEDALEELAIVEIGVDETNLLLLEGHVRDILSDETLNLALLMAILANSLAPRASTRTQARMALLLGGLQRRNGDLVESVENLRRAEHLSQPTSNDLIKSLIAGELAQCFHKMGESKKAQKYFEQAAKLSLQQEPAYARACLANLAEIHEKAGDLKLAIAVGKRALKAAYRANDSRAQANSLGYLGELLKRVGRQEEAVQALRQAVEKSREAGDAQDEAWRCFLLAETLWPYDKENALSLYREAIRVVPAETDWNGASLYLAVFERHLRDEGYFDEAQEVCRQAILLSHQLGDRHEEDKFRSLLADVLLRIYRLEEAGEEYERALALSIAEGDQIAQSHHLAELADIQFRLGRVQEAVKYGIMALQSTKQIGDVKEGIYRLQDLARFCSAEGNLIQSQAYAGEAIALAEKKEDGRLLADTLIEAAKILKVSGLPEKALVMLQQAIVISKAEEVRPLEIQALKQLSDVLWVMGLNEDSIDTLKLGLETARNANQPQLQLELIESLNFLDDTQVVWDDVESIGNQVLAIGQDSGDMETLSSCLQCLGNIFASRDPQRAIGYYEELVHLYRSQRQPYRLAVTLTGLGELWQNLGNMEKAIQCHNQALNALVTNQPIQYRAYMLYSLADAHRRLGHQDESQEYFDMASQLIERDFSLNIFSETAYLIQSRRGDFYFDFGKWEEAMDAYRLAVELSSRFFQMAVTANVRWYWIDSSRLHYMRLIQACLKVSDGSGSRRDQGKRAALGFVEEARSRFFLGELGQTSFSISSNLSGEWIERESNALAGLKALERENLGRFGQRLGSPVDIWIDDFISERLRHWNELQEIWAEIEASGDTGREYVTLRKGETVVWANLLDLLATDVQG